MNDVKTRLNIEKNIRNNAVLFSVFIIFAVIVPIHFYYERKIPEIQDQNIILSKKDNTDFFGNLDIKAKSVIVWDARENKILYGMNEDAQLPLASLTKIMTSLIATESFSPQEIITIDKDALNEEGDSGLVLDEKWKISDLLALTLVSSSNDGAKAVANAISVAEEDPANKTSREYFSEKMNEKAKELGLVQTYFINETGLDMTQNVGGAYGSAKDIAILLEYIIKNNPKILEATSHSSLEIYSQNLKHKIKNTNSDVEKISGILASKTGFTDLAGGNLAIAYDIGIDHPIIIVVLGSTKDGRFEDVKKLIDASIKHFSSNLYQ